MLPDHGLPAQTTLPEGQLSRLTLFDLRLKMSELHDTAIERCHAEMTRRLSAVTLDNRSRADFQFVRCDVVVEQRSAGLSRGRIDLESR
jgi:hypothetical protein